MSAPGSPQELATRLRPWPQRFESLLLRTAQINHVDAQQSRLSHVTPLILIYKRALFTAEIISREIQSSLRPLLTDNVPLALYG